MTTYLVYDDRSAVPQEIASLVGISRFSDIVFRRQLVAQRTSALAERFDWTFIRLDQCSDESELTKRISPHAASRVVCLASSLAPADESRAIDRLERLALVRETCQATIHQQPAPLVAAQADIFLRNFQADSSWGIPGQTVGIPIDDAFVDLSDPFTLVDYLSGSFNSRCFNCISRSGRTAVKHSSDISKIKAEHDYFHLLPEDMRHWFVMPYGLKVDEQGASYSMERLLVVDMGQQWINGGFSSTDFSRLLDDLTVFLGARKRRSCTRERARSHFDRLYVEKPRHRQEDLRSGKMVAYLEDMLRNGTSFRSLSDLMSCYLDLVMSYRNQLPDYECIGHGDLCFSNILYDKRIRLIRLIDPKGASNEDELYMDPLYDYAKLSHSVLGGYDFIANGLYDILVDTELKLRLQTPEPDFAAYADIFVSKLEHCGINMKQQRLYEASLFLSMLPLHLDRPRDLLAFTLIAVHTLETVAGRGGR